MSQTIAEMVVEKLLESGALAEYLNEHLTETFLNGVEKMVMPRLFKELKQSVEAAKRSAEDAASAISALRRESSPGAASSNSNSGAKSDVKQCVCALTIQPLQPYSPPATQIHCPPCSLEGHHPACTALRHPTPCHARDRAILQHQRNTRWVRPSAPAAKAKAKKAAKPKKLGSSASGVTLD